MKILHVSSEVAPFSKTGGLADVCAALPRELAARGHEAVVVTPLYSQVDTSALALTPVRGAEHVELEIGPHRVGISLVQTRLPGAEVTVVFVRCDRLYARGALYTEDPDEALRFVVLSYAAFTACQHLRFAPDIVHAHDWQAALLPLVLRCRYAWDARCFAGTKTVFTVHNLAHQGAFGAERLVDTGLADSAHLFHQDQLQAGSLNLMTAGLLHADAITTVSPTYAQEIQTPEQGMGLDAVLRGRAGAIVGLLNGIDPSLWSPETDRHLARNYGLDTLADKEANKRALLEEVGLPYRPGLPVVGLVSRLSWQKGLELVLEATPAFIAEDRIQLVVLGTGEARYEQAFHALAARHPGRVHFHAGYSNPLAHRIEAGADLFLMPSRFEPCGLNQMYSMAYGTAPIVRATGGLADSVRHFTAETGEGTGFVFEHFDPEGLRWALERALETYAVPEAFRRLQRNAMAQDLSWKRRVEGYEALYRRVGSLSDPS